MVQQQQLPVWDRFMGVCGDSDIDSLTSAHMIAECSTKRHKIKENGKHSSIQSNLGSKMHVSPLHYEALFELQSNEEWKFW